MIRQAVEKIYNVKVRTVRTANRKGKLRRVRFKFGKTAEWKKAVVVLHADHHIDLF
jgi:large subunit ribosomal protein L23